MPSFEPPMWRHYNATSQLPGCEDSWELEFIPLNNREVDFSRLYEIKPTAGWYVTRTCDQFEAIVPEKDLVNFMMTSSNGNIFRVTDPLCGEFTGPGEFPTQRPVTRSFDVYFDLRLNKRLSKQPWGWWFETPLWSLWRQCNVPVAPLNEFLCS